MPVYCTLDIHTLKSCFAFVCLDCCQCWHKKKFYTQQSEFGLPSPNCTSPCPGQFLSLHITRYGSNVLFPVNTNYPAPSCSFPSHALSLPSYMAWLWRVSRGEKSARTGSVENSSKVGWGVLIRGGQWKTFASGYKRRRGQKETVQRTQFTRFLFKTPEIDTNRLSGCFAANPTSNSKWTKNTFLKWSFESGGHMG